MVFAVFCSKAFFAIFLQNHPTFEVSFLTNKRLDYFVPFALESWFTQN
jgi:hypothetical protein